MAIDPESVRWGAWAVTIFAGLTMVSNFKYYSFKTINLRRSVPFVVVLGFVLLFVLVSLPAGDRAVRGVRRLRRLRLRVVGMAGAEAPPRDGMPRAARPDDVQRRRALQVAANVRL